MYQFESRVRYSETDSRGRLTPDGMMEYFEDCTTFQSEDLGIGVQFLKEHHCVWVLSFVQIVMKRYRSLGEYIVVQTIPYDIKGFLGYRNFILRTQEGEELACANTMWTYLDTDTGRPIKAPESMIAAYGLSERYPMDYASRKIVLPDDLQSFEEIIVKPHHLDTNDHVNNVEYVRMARELMQEAGRAENVQDADIPCGMDAQEIGAAGDAQNSCGSRSIAAGEPFLCGIRVEYKQSALLGDVIHPAGAWDAGENRMVVSLNDKNGKPYAVVELKYGKE